MGKLISAVSALINETPKLTLSGTSKSSSLVSLSPRGIMGTLMDSLEEDKNLFGGWIKNFGCILWSGD